MFTVEAYSSVDGSYLFTVAAPVSRQLDAMRIAAKIWRAFYDGAPARFMVRSGNVVF